MPELTSGHFPSARAIQELVTAWKELRMFRQRGVVLGEDSRTNRRVPGTMHNQYRLLKQPSGVGTVATKDDIGGCQRCMPSLPSEE
jgi:hypothetical protein